MLLSLVYSGNQIAIPLQYRDGDFSFYLFLYYGAAKRVTENVHNPVDRDHNGKPEHTPEYMLLPFGLARLVPRRGEEFQYSVEEVHQCTSKKEQCQGAQNRPLGIVNQLSGRNVWTKDLRKLHDGF